MKRDNWKVGEYGTRPAGSPNHCFYCGVERGGTHEKECVIRNRTIVMEMKVEMVIEVPEKWDKDMCEFHKNESSWCASNILRELERMDDKMGCLCLPTEFSYVREATKEDEDKHGIHISESES